MVKQVFQAVHFDKPFNEIVEEAAEWKKCEREQANKKRRQDNLSGTALCQANVNDDAGLL